jgi:hypothetical protein
MSDVDVDDSTHEYKFDYPGFLLYTMMKLLGFIAPEHHRCATDLVLHAFDITIVRQGDGELDREMLFSMAECAIEDTDEFDLPYNLTDSETADYLWAGIEEMEFSGG